MQRRAPALAVTLANAFPAKKEHASPFDYCDIVTTNQGLAAVAAVKRQQTVGLDGRWQHVRSARRALEGVHCRVRAFEPIRLDVWCTQHC
jgi:hypothetical protein